MQAVRTRITLAFTALSLFVVAPAAAHEPVTSSSSSSTSARFDTYVKGAAELEGKIIAPCCWTQTIDIHGSELSTQLRQEIRRRLLAGETSASIEASLVERHGAKVLAVPVGSRLGSAGGILIFAMGAAGLGAVMLLRRWQRRSKVDSAEGGESHTKPRSNDAALDARIDAELAQLDRD